ncbi:CoA-binding protein [Thauera humireducens]|uniref:CoA-binding protein n=1 Tax=Thauera humireducens TaxID=1134435 RepID=A0A127K6U1_9RHOO|nr:CoA-binding protein [Thauera humireducens]AMO37683.1 CoA-binding protein [Thauera humireducens]
MHINDISADRAATRALLQDTRTIAIVGLSPNPQRPSNEVARYLRAAGYTIIPVNPACDQVLGEKCYASLREIPGPVDLVDVFRRPEDVMPIVDDAIAIGARGLWLQLGVIAPEAARRAADAGLKVVMDRCTKVEHAVLIGR